MSRVNPVPLYTHKDYDTVDRGPCGERFEFIDGEIIAMVGGNLRHNVITSQVQRALDRMVQSPCRVMREAFRLHIRTQDTDAICYPDVFITCQKLGMEDTEATDATLIVEVASESTRQYDASTKLERYLQLPSLREVILVESHLPKVTVHRNNKQVASVETYVELTDTILVDGASGLLRLADIYEGIAFSNDNN